ncbi:DUF6516 family protein [Skermanella mucosa]|uniref:toxin-antitoxin system TumE family protein n=1 Tax=Skermanella mucosa TaxID=1789672 RepID=UPI00192C47CD|nr:DUF6516 family protein [Skermanella mucosa]UEM21091.1 DUF6516 family protein [Skermanella mucosa]
MEGLLDLHGSILEMGGGYWVKIVAQAIPPDQERPYGISYSLTLHHPDGSRMMGYDNAHPIRTGRSAAKADPGNFDHRHLRGKTASYLYSDAQSLLGDFWNDVNAILKEEGVP